MGVNVSNDISLSPGSAHTIHSPKFMYTSREGLYQRIAKYETLNFLDFFFFGGGRVTWYSLGNHKMCNI